MRRIMHNSSTKCVSRHLGVIQKTPFFITIPHGHLIPSCIGQRHRKTVERSSQWVSALIVQDMVRCIQTPCRRGSWKTFDLHDQAILSAFTLVMPILVDGHVNNIGSWQDSTWQQWPNPVPFHLPLHLSNTGGACAWSLHERPTRENCFWWWPWAVD